MALIDVTRGVDPFDWVTGFIFLRRDLLVRDVARAEASIIIVLTLSFLYSSAMRSPRRDAYGIE